MSFGSTSVPSASALEAGTPPRLSSNVVGACLRSAFIEALYDDCTDMLIDSTAHEPLPPLPLAAE